MGDSVCCFLQWLHYHFLTPDQFSFFMKPMFESYKKEAATDNLDTFMSSVTNWTKETLGLSNLRHREYIASCSLSVHIDSVKPRTDWISQVFV